MYLTASIVRSSLWLAPPISTIITSTMRMILRERRLENDWNVFAIIKVQRYENCADYKKIAPFFFNST